MYRLTLLPHTIFHNEKEYKFLILRNDNELYNGSWVAGYFLWRNKDCFDLRNSIIRVCCDEFVGIVHEFIKVWKQAERDGLICGNIWNGKVLPKCIANSGRTPISLHSIKHHGLQQNYKK